MENYMFKSDEIKKKCYELNKSIAEKSLELNIVPGQHISEKYVAGYHIGIHKNLQEPPISQCYVSFEAIEACFRNDNCTGLKRKLDEALSEALALL
ncbi:MAG: hypothetical protein JRH08_17740 [Deltaproteobacteria bacterium]|nr:hypothetical protein [Deltaproteobacteria bacterium]